LHDNRHIGGLERSDIKEGIEGEPDLRGEPAASGAEKVLHGNRRIGGLERSDIKRSGANPQ